MATPMQTYSGQSYSGVSQSSPSQSTKKHLKILWLGASVTLFMLPSAALAGSPDIYEPSLLPSDPRVGHCYARVEIPAQYQTGTQSVLVEEGYHTTEVTQPKLASRTQQVEIKEPSIRYEVRQPTFKTVREQMLVRPAYDKLSVSTPRFETVTETIQTSGPRRVWKMGNPSTLRSQGYRILSTADGGPAGRGYRSTSEYGAARSHTSGQASITQQFGGSGAMRCGDGCEIWCLVEEPADQVSFNRKVLVSGGEVRRVPVPAKYTTISKQVVSDPGGVREIPVAGQYRSVQIEELVEMGREYTKSMPPKYGDVQTRTLISAPRYEWRETICSPSGSSASRYSSGTTSQYSSGSTLSGASSHSSSLNNGSAYGATHGSSYGTNGYTGGSRSYGRSGAYSNSDGSSPIQSYYYGSDKPVSGSRHKQNNHGVHRKRRH